MEAIQGKRKESERKRELKRERNGREMLGGERERESSLVFLKVFSMAFSWESHSLALAVHLSLCPLSTSPTSSLYSLFLFLVLPLFLSLSLSSLSLSPSLSLFLLLNFSLSLSGLQAHGHHTSQCPLCTGQPGATSNGGRREERDCRIGSGWPKRRREREKGGKGGKCERNLKKRFEEFSMSDLMDSVTIGVSDSHRFSISDSMKLSLLEL
jgi:hypothetical protein